MKRNASAATNPSGRVALFAGLAAIVAALAIAVIAARPGTGTAIPSPSAVPAAAAATPTGALSAKETGFGFGSISMAAGKVSHRYWFRNASAAPVMIQRIYTSCMCTTATLVQGMRVIGTYGMPGHGPVPDVNQSLAPGEAAYVDAVFDPAAHGPAGLGHTERVITIEPRAGEPLQLAFTAEVRP